MTKQTGQFPSFKLLSTCFEITSYRTFKLGPGVLPSAGASGPAAISVSLCPSHLLVLSVASNQNAHLVDTDHVVDCAVGWMAH